jgi:predicted dehydrogenase
VTATANLPALGFLGVGWIGRQRLDDIVASGVARVGAVADPAVQGSFGSLDELLDAGVDGIVIATPSALHAAQAVAALERGVPVFCQKPLALDAATARHVVDAARAAGVLLEIDFSYRFTEAARALRDVVASGALGEIFAADLVFHNAYGPDKAWFSDPGLSGGGCVIDLGIHLVDLALWVLDWPEVEHVAAHLHGMPLEDHAEAQVVLASGAVVRLTSSWRLHAGRDCILEARFYGTHVGVSLHNVDGSFYDFVAERHAGTSSVTIAAPPDAWSGRAAVDWARRVAEGEGFDPEIEHAVHVHELVDRIYGRAA